MQLYSSLLVNIKRCKKGEKVMDDRPGCLSGLLKLFLLDRLFGWLQSRFGFGSGNCFGCGCGTLLLIVFVILVLSVITGTDWFQFGF